MSFTRRGGSLHIVVGFCRRGQETMLSIFLHQVAGEIVRAVVLWYGEAKEWYSFIAPFKSRSRKHQVKLRVFSVRAAYLSRGTHCHSMQSNYGLTRRLHKFTRGVKGLWSKQKPLMAQDAPAPKFVGARREQWSIVWCLLWSFTSAW